VKSANGAVKRNVSVILGKRRKLKNMGVTEVSEEKELLKRMWEQTKLVAILQSKLDRAVGMLDAIVFLFADSQCKSCMEMVERARQALTELRGKGGGK